MYLGLNEYTCSFCHQSHPNSSKKLSAPNPPQQKPGCVLQQDDFWNVADAFSFGPLCRLVRCLHHFPGFSSLYLQLCCPYVAVAVSSSWRLGGIVKLLPSSCHLDSVAVNWKLERSWHTMACKGLVNGLYKKIFQMETALCLKFKVALIGK